MSFLKLEPICFHCVAKNKHLQEFPELLSLSCEDFVAKTNSNIGLFFTQSYNFAIEDLKLYYLYSIFVSFLKLDPIHFHCVGTPSRFSRMSLFVFDRMSSGFGTT